MRLPFAFLVKEESDDLLTQVAGNRHNLPLPHSEEKFGMSSRTCVFVARRIITMNPSLPSTTHVAVRDRRILGYGDADAVGRLPMPRSTAGLPTSSSCPALSRVIAICSKAPCGATPTSASSTGADRTAG